MTADVSNEADIVRVIETTESEVGPIALFCSNAGIGAGVGARLAKRGVAAQLGRQRHVPRLRGAAPGAEDGGARRWLLPEHVVSAAGLLNQIGGAAYGTTKHAAMGFGEWLALTHAHEGIKVSLLCPQAVRTADDGRAAGVRSRPRPATA